MTTLKPNPENVPVSVFVALSIIVIFLLFNVQVVTSIPCGKNMHEVFMGQFVHIDSVHLISNLYALYAISRVEQEMGFKPFIWLLIFLLSFNTLVEYIVRKLWKDLPCSIGFSGILFGLMTWELVSKKDLDRELILAIIIMVIGPSLKTKNVSLLGHSVGAVSGVIAGLMWGFINKK
jgi:membrane associated rhomboid family serine protease